MFIGQTAHFQTAMPMKSMDNNAGSEWLNDRGFNLLQVVDTARLPEELIQSLIALGVEVRKSPRLVLLGMGGPGLWNRVKNKLESSPDPFDDDAVSSVHTVALEFWRCTEVDLLYPGPLPLPLQKLGQFAGWSYPSPIGIDLHPRYGPWFAFRAVFLIDVPLPPSAYEPGEAPCQSCQAKPCESACPAGAVQYGSILDIQACMEQRLLPRSSCGDRCFSRLACPVGKHWRYPDEQITYHGRRSLQSLKRWRQKTQGTAQ